MSFVMKETIGVGTRDLAFLPVMDSNHSVTQVKLEKTDPGVLVLQNIQGYARPHPAAL